MTEVSEEDLGDPGLNLHSPVEARFNHELVTH